MNDFDIPRKLDITPSPRVLDMLGEIEFAPWRCVAELIDNSVDSFLDMLELEPGHEGPFKVSVALPSTRSDADEATITVTDTGPGMTVKQLNDAVRAGWTGNDPFEYLGLFGMGFNIATARLGNRTRVLTTRVGDPEWYGVEIDVRRLQEDASFDVPFLREAKEDVSVHGTRIEVSRLRPGNYEELVRNPRTLAQQLGDVYGPLLLRQPNIEIWINNIKVRPRGYCAWDEGREVTYGSGANAEVVPAVIRFDERLPQRDACRSCRRWQESPNVEQCEFCASEDLVTRERRIHGWVGVQRYLHPSDYGIDFVRNGRKIMIRDKSLFQWTDPNDVAHTEHVEYPIEPPANEGRLIGEVHVDHVPVEYRKETFRTDTPEWQAVRRFLRGDGGPMRPQSRAERGYDRFAEGPLARIYRAFNANRPGARYLIPAAPGGPALHDKAREWGERFHAGDPDYLDDSVWWAAIEAYERAKDGAADLQDLLDPEDQKKRDELVEVFGEDAFGGVTDANMDAEATEDDEGGGNDIGASEPTEEVQTPETLLDRLSRYRENALPLPELEFKVTLPGSLGAVDLTTYWVTEEPVLDDENQRVPVLPFLGQRENLDVFIDANHPLFTRFDTQATDMVLAEVADIFRARFRASMTLGQIIARIKEENLPDRRLDEAISAEAGSVLRRIRGRMATLFGCQPDVATQAVELLVNGERSTAETLMSADNSRKTFDQAVEDGSIARYLPAHALPRIVEALPDRLLDGAVFNTMYGDVSDHARRRHVAIVVGYLYDIALLAEGPITLRGDALRRAALAVHLIDDEIVEQGEAV